MTFSEDDLLPYKELTYKLDSHYFKTILMQWTILDSILQENGGHVIRADPNDIPPRMMVLDVCDSMPDPYNDPGHFAASFEQLVNRNKSELLTRSVRLRKLKQFVVRLLQPDMAQVKIEVEQLVINELKATGVCKKLWIEENLRTKAYVLAEFRLRDKISGCKPGGSSVNANQRRFIVHLIRLIGGFDDIRKIKLAFDFNAPFHAFERVLQEQTKLCIIPHNDIPAVDPSESENLSSSTPFNAASHPASEIYDAYGTTWVKVKLPYTRPENGYTVKDGPWLCRISYTKGTKGDEEYRINDLNSYDALKAKLEALHQRYPSSDYLITIMHSNDRAIFSRSQLQKFESRKLWVKRSKGRGGFDEEAEDNDDSEVPGETFYEWLCRKEQI